MDDSLFISEEYMYNLRYNLDNFNETKFSLNLLPLFDDFKTVKVNDTTVNGISID